MNRVWPHSLSVRMAAIFLNVIDLMNRKATVYQ